MEYNEEALKRINQKVCRRVLWFADSMRALHGEILTSIVAYGSVLDADYYYKTSNINLLLVFQKITVETLKKSLRLIRKGRKRKIVAPLFFTESHILNSCDTFPMEFIELKEKHALLWGRDPFETLMIRRDNLRLECEHQLKALIIKLRQSYLEIGLTHRGVECLLIDSMRTLLPILRTVIRYAGGVVPDDNESIIRQSLAIASINDECFLQLFKDKKGDERIGGKKAEVFFEGYLNQLELLANYIDSL